MFSLIACIGKNRELGKKGELVFHIKEDMKFFRETTMNHKVVMGRKTWESLPGKLKGRENIVISRGAVEGADLVVTDIAQFVAENKNTEEEIFVIGGGMVYAEFLPVARVLYLTEVEAGDETADAFFPEFDRANYNREMIKKGTDNGVVFVVTKYTLK